GSPPETPLGPATATGCCSGTRLSGCADEYCRKPCPRIWSLTCGLPDDYCAKPTPRLCGPAACNLPTTNAASRTPISADLSARTATRAAGRLRPVRLCPRRVPRNRLNVTGSLRQEISFRAFPGRGLMRYTRVAAASFLTAVFLFSSEIGSIGTAAAQTPT